jgi:hypothetical protein
MSGVEVLSGPERRRRWSAEQKRSVVAEAFAPGASVCEVARRRDVRAWAEGAIITGEWMIVGWSTGRASKKNHLPKPINDNP